MKYFLIIMSAFMWAVVLSTMMTCSATADDSTNWTTENSKLEFAHGALLTMDYLQTLDIQNHPDIEEANPLARSLLGSNPGSVETTVYFAAAGAIHYGISRTLPKGWREAWQYGTIMVQGGVVANNWAIGLRVPW